MARRIARAQGNFNVAIVTIRNFYVIDDESQAVMVSAMFRLERKTAKRRNAFTELFHLDHGKFATFTPRFY